MSTAAGPSTTAGATGAGARERLAWAAVAFLSLLVLLVASRGAPLGVPAADDYLFLHQQRFGNPDFFGSYGAAWYWRPVSRQLYFSLLGPWLPQAAWLIPVLHGALLLVTFAALAALARRVLSPRAALVAAAFPLLVEPARVLLSWPSASQHLIAMAAVSSALAAAAAGRLALSLAAAALALGSIETAALALPLIPLLAPRGAAGGRSRWVIGTLALAAAWVALRVAVAAHGVRIPSGGATPSPLAMAHALWLGLAAQLGIEDLPAPAAAVVLAGYAAALAGAWWTSRRAAEKGARPPRVIRAWALGGLLWWTAGTLPLAGILPNWNAWRSSLPGLGLGVAFAALFARGRAWPVLLFLAVRAGALLLASPAPALVSSQGPPTTSHLSFVRLVRLQRTLEATRTVLLHEARPARGGLVRYWNYPWMSEFAFAGPAAIQVWLGDPTAQWGPFGGATGFQDTTTPVIAFNPDSIRLAVRIHPEAQRLLLLANQAMRAGRLVEADAQLARALAIQTVPSVRLRAVVLANRSAVRLSLGDLRGADSLHRAGIDAIPSIEWLREERTLALALGDTVRARRAMMVSRQIEGRTPGTGGAPAR